MATTSVEILAALVNGVLPVRDGHRHPVRDVTSGSGSRPTFRAGPSWRVAGLGLLVNLAGLWLLHGGARGEPQRAQRLPRGGWATRSAPASSSWPACSSSSPVGRSRIRSRAPLIALFLLPRTWALLRQTVNVLLEGAPATLDVTENRGGAFAAPLLGAPGPRFCTLWTLTSGREAMSVHVVVEAGAPSDKILEALHVILHARFGIDHTTIQIETEPAPSHPDHPEGGLTCCAARGTSSPPTWAASRARPRSGICWCARTGARRWTRPRSEREVGAALSRVVTGQLEAGHRRGQQRRAAARGLLHLRGLTHEGLRGARAAGSWPRT